MRHPAGRVLLPHHAGGAVGVVQHHPVKGLGRVVAQSLDGESRLVLPPEEQARAELVTPSHARRASFCQGPTRSPRTLLQGTGRWR